MTGVIVHRVDTSDLLATDWPPPWAIMHDGYILADYSVGQMNECVLLSANISSKEVECSYLAKITKRKCWHSKHGKQFHPLVPNRGFAVCLSVICSGTGEVACRVNWKHLTDQLQLPESIRHSYTWQAHPLSGCSNYWVIGLNPLHVRCTRPCQFTEENKSPVVADVEKIIHNTFVLFFCHMLSIWFEPHSMIRSVRSPDLFCCEENKGRCSQEIYFNFEVRQQVIEIPVHDFSYSQNSQKAICL